MSGILTPQPPYFNSRPRVGANQCDRNHHSRRRYFNSRPRVGANVAAGQNALLTEFQFTPPCGGEPEIEARAKSNSISIHAPVWGRTKTVNRAVRHEYFNSRPRVGANAKAVEMKESGIFQFTPPCGGERRRKSNRRHRPDFNSRPRVGANVSVRVRLSVYVYFNSRPRVGANAHGKYGWVKLTISIHAPVWGRTPRCSTQR